VRPEAGRIRRSLRRIAPVATKELRQVVRDWRTLALLLFFPALMMVLFGFALNFDVKHVPLAVLDLDHTPRSRSFAQSFLHSEYFELSGYLEREAEIDEVLDQGRVQVVLVIPTGFEASLGRGEEVEVQANVDGANSNSAAAVLGYINAICLDYAGRVRTRALARAGLGGLAMPIDYRPRVWYNPELKSARFLIPGIMVQILLILTVVSTSLSLVREKERGTMEQVVVSPLRPIEVILGKTGPYLFISLIGSGIVLLTGWLLFGVVVKGSWLLLFVSLLVFLVGGLGLGLLISTLTSTQRSAFQLSALLTLLPSIILSGFIFPIRNMPIPIQAASYLIPARYFLPVLRGIIIKGTGLTAFWPDLLFLVAFAVLMLGVSTVRLRRQMS
jgi:ABC-2 type transport system permease protein